MVMEDSEAPHHMLLLRNFMSQGLIHHQPLIYASPAKDPRGFLGTLPNPMAPKDDKSRVHETEQVPVYSIFYSLNLVAPLLTWLVAFQRKVYIYCRRRD